MAVVMGLNLYAQPAAARLVRYHRSIIHGICLPGVQAPFLLLTIRTSNHRWQRAASTLGCLGVACLLGTSEQPTASSRRDCFHCQAPVALAVSQAFVSNSHILACFPLTPSLPRPTQTLCCACATHHSFHTAAAPPSLYLYTTTNTTRFTPQQLHTISQAPELSL